MSCVYLFPINCGQHVCHQIAEFLFRKKQELFKNNKESSFKGMLVNIFSHNPWTATCNGLSFQNLSKKIKLKQVFEELDQYKWFLLMNDEKLLALLDVLPENENQ